MRAQSNLPVDSQVNGKTDLRSDFPVPVAGKLIVEVTAPTDNTRNNNNNDPVDKNGVISASALLYNFYCRDFSVRFSQKWQYEPDHIRLSAYTVEHPYFCSAPFWTKFRGIVSSVLGFWLCWARVSSVSSLHHNLYILELAQVLPPWYFRFLPFLSYFLGFKLQCQIAVGSFVSRPRRVTCKAFVRGGEVELIQSPTVCL